jgi:hypothetical protein
MVVDSGVIADPDIVFFVTFQPRIVKDFRPVLHKGVVHEGITVNLRLMNDARSADRRPLVDLQKFVAVGGQPLGGDNQAVGRMRARSARRQKPRTQES